jgi:hypothetical protein
VRRQAVRIAVVVALLAAAWSVSSAPGVSAAPAPAAPTVSAPAAARPGDLIVVTLANWPAGVVTIGTCSNAAARGTEDCALAGDNAIAIRDSKPVALDLHVELPPGPCPCVIRATTPSGTPVVTAPIVIVGVPVEPIIQPARGPTGGELHVHSSVVTVDEKFPSSVIAPLAGSVHKVLRVDITNSSASAAHLHVVAEVGKGHEKEPIAARNVRALQPGGHRRLDMPFVISAPAWGTYTVTGSVYGGASPVVFRSTTSNDPWLLELMVPILLIMIAELMRARERRDRRLQTAAEAEQLAAEATAAPVPGESSPEVGGSYGERYPVAPYDPTRNGGTGHAAGANPGADAGVALTI